MKIPKLILKYTNNVYLPLTNLKIITVWVEHQTKLTNEKFSKSNYL
jgi:hypothetical protein